MPLVFRLRLVWFFVFLFCFCFAFAFVRELADGVFSCAAVPRGGLGPLPPPLCRFAEYTVDQLLETLWAINSCAPAFPAALALGVYGAAESTW
jgi:hypothetical protein